MTTATAVVNDFRFVGPWRPIACLIVIGAVMLAAGCGLTIASEQALASGHSLVLFLTTATLGGLLAACGPVVAGTGLWFALLRAARRRVVRAVAGGLWIWRPFVWWSRFVPFESVRWVKRARPKEGADFVQIVHGPALATESVGAGLIGPAGYGLLLALLADRCPAAFTPNPPEGWRPPID